MTDPQDLIIPTPAHLAEIPLEQAIPQRPPMVMIDALTGCGADSAESVYTVAPDCLFIEEGRLSAYGMIENVAQTCAARIGYHAVVNHLPVRLGFIGAFSNLQVRELPAVGQTLCTAIKVTCEVFSMLLVDAEVRADGCDEPLLTASMKIALSDIEAQS